MPHSGLFHFILSTGLSGRTPAVFLPVLLGQF